MLETVEASAAGLAFDRLAPRYDSMFTLSAVGRSQRRVVWKQMLKTFDAGSHLLELNCGTGADALFLAKAGMTITACDASAGMIAQACAKKALESPNARVEFLELATEEVSGLLEMRRFDGVFSNFSGLNCVRDLRGLAQQLERRLAPGTPLLLCLSTRFCLWEIAYYLLRGDAQKAFRRCRGSALARVGGVEFPVYYPTHAELCRAFSPGFHLVSTTGVGIVVPPSYLESWIARRPRLLAALEAIDARVRALPGARVLGDHMLLHLEKV